MAQSEQYEELTVESTDGPVRIAYRKSGSGPPLLLVHGFLGNADDWDLLPELQLGVCAIMPDLRGHGRSSNPAEHFSFRAAAVDLLQLLDRLDIATCLAVGLSGGALTLLRMAIEGPRLFTRLVLVSATDRFTERSRAAMQSYLAGLQEKEVRELAARHSSAQRADALLSAAARFAGGVDDATTVPAELATIQARTLLVAGELDPFYPLDASRRMAATIPACELWTVPRGGHTPVFAEARGEFLGRARSALGLDPRSR